MSGFDPRDYDAREADDGVHDRENEWIVIGRDPRDQQVAPDPAKRDSGNRDVEREERDRASRDRGTQESPGDPRDTFARDLDLPHGRDRELVHDRYRD